MIHVLNHVQQALELLLAQYQGQPNIEALIRAWVAQVQDLEDALWQVLDSRTLQGTGDQLDQLGAIVGIPRAGRTDAEFAAAISVQVAVNNSDGTVRHIMRILESFATNWGAEFQYSEPDTATIYVQADTPVGVLPSVYDALKRAKPLGVRLFVDASPVIVGFDYIEFDHTDLDLPDAIGFAHTSGLPNNGPSHVAII